MSIINAFDLSNPIITPDKIYDAKYQFDKCIVTFSKYVFKEVIDNYKWEIIDHIGFANIDINLYHLLDYDVLFYLSPIGAAISATSMQEINQLAGVKQFIYFGSCGLINEIAKNKIIIPSKAYREEGMSYHYCQPSDYIDINNYQLIENILDKHNIPYIVGKTWTTDATYRETINKVKLRKSEGCLCVEMEASALQAVANYLNINLYIFFFTGDILSDEWDRADLGGEKERNKQLNCFEIALLIAKDI